MADVRAFMGQKVGIGTRTPTALIQISAGAAAVGSAPIKLTEGPLLTVPEIGAVEFLDDGLFFTPDTGIRQRVSFTSSGGSYTVLAPNTDTGTVNNWAPVGFAGNSIIPWAGVADAIFTGLAGGTAGQFSIVKNYGTKNAYFVHQSAGSIAANRYLHVVTSGSMPVAPGGWIAHYHDGTQWRLIAHEQGAAITAAFDASNFTASAAMGWGVDVGDILTLTYRLRGTRIEIDYYLTLTSVTGTPDIYLRIGNGNYGGFTVASRASGIYIAEPTNVASFVSFWLAVTGEAYFRLLNGLGNNWSVTANACNVYGTASFPVN